MQVHVMKLGVPQTYVKYTALLQNLAEATQVEVHFSFFAVLFIGTSNEWWSVHLFLLSFMDNCGSGNEAVTDIY